jgi:hypothetical protein
MTLLQPEASQSANGSTAGAAERRRIERDLHDGVGFAVGGTTVRGHVPWPARRGRPMKPGAHRI